MTRPIRTRVIFLAALVAAVWQAATHLALAATQASSAEGALNDRAEHVPTAVVILAFALIAVAGALPLLSGRFSSRTDD